MPRQKPLVYFTLFLSLSTYGLLGYGVPRYETVWLFLLFFLLFSIYLWIVRTTSEDQIAFWIYVSIVFRLSLLFATPSLSDDFYRFIWDGRLLANGIHPFAELPGFYLAHNLNIPGIDESLYAMLNSKEYFTIYPPFAQYIFLAAVKVFPTSLMGSVVVMRLFILAAEIGSVFVIRNLLKEFSLPQKNVLLYALNPLIIMELTGNLHFEAFVIFFILVALYLLVRSKMFLAAVSFAFSIAAKLLPLIFLPLFLLRLGLKRTIYFYSVIAGVSLLLFFPLLNLEIVDGFFQSFSLYFRRFEFNASIYYLVREYGFLTKGYKIIQTVGWKLGIISAVGILFISLWPYAVTKYQGKLNLDLKSFSFPEGIKNIPQVMMWVLLFYFLLTTTLHPWYITTLLMVSLLTPYRFVIVWSAMIFLTYAGYMADGFAENLYLTALEYVVVIGYLVYELTWQRKYFYLL